MYKQSVQGDYRVAYKVLQLECGVCEDRLNQDVTGGSVLEAMCIGTTFDDLRHNTAILLLRSPPL